MLTCIGTGFLMPPPFYGGVAVVLMLHFLRFLYVCNTVTLFDPELWFDLEVITTKFRMVIVGVV